MLLLLDGKTLGIVAGVDENDDAAVAVVDEDNARGRVVIPGNGRAGTEGAGGMTPGSVSPSPCP